MADTEQSHPLAESSIGGAATKPPGCMPCASDWFHVSAVPPAKLLLSVSFTCYLSFSTTVSLPVHAIQSFQLPH